VFLGRQFLVSGAARGIGAGICRALVERGATVVGLDVTDGGDELPREVDLRRCDVTDQDGLADLMSDIGPSLAGVVCVAAVVRPGPLESLTQRHWEEVLAVNLTGPWLTMRAAFTALRAQQGSIVLISSIAGIVPFPGGGAYAPSKSGLVALARQAAVEWGPVGIRVNAVSPGSTLTPMNAAVHDDDSRSARVAATPLRRLATADDIAKTACFLLSDEARHITGQDIVVDGGFLQSTLPSPVAIAAGELS